MEARCGGEGGGDVVEGDVMGGMGETETIVRDVVMGRGEDESTRSDEDVEAMVGMYMGAVAGGEVLKIITGVFTTIER